MPNVFSALRAVYMILHRQSTPYISLYTSTHNTCVTNVVFARRAAYMMFFTIHHILYVQTFIFALRAADVMLYTNLVPS